ncbi:MAG: SDR family NAD(P)-dependent oxidoreductase [bacterium]
MTNAKNRAALVTGTSAGIGRAIALELDKAGYRVFAGVRQAADGENLKRDASPLLTPVIVDITNAEQIAAMVRTVEAALGPDQGLHALVNNAGIAIAGPLEFLRAEEIRRVLDVNLVGQLAVIQACLPLLRKGGGRIVQITSGIRNLGLPFLGAYALSKAGLHIACDVLRRELRPSRIPVSEVVPGIVKTPIWDKYRTPADDLQRSMKDTADSQAQSMGKGRRFFDRLAKHGHEPEKVARAVLRALDARCPAIQYTVGWDTRFALLLPRIVPARVMDALIAAALKE